MNKINGKYSTTACAAANINEEVDRVLNNPKDCTEMDT
jgi:hypothetical protein